MKHQVKYYNQTELADLLSVSKATISRYINKLNISGNIKNKEKLYPETILKQLRNELKPTKTNKNRAPSTIQLLQDQIEQLKDENKTLKEQLKIKDEQIKTASKLADQAQQLNALDKQKIEEPKKKKHWWQ